MQEQVQRNRRHDLRKLKTSVDQMVFGYLHFIRAQQGNKQPSTGQMVGRYAKDRMASESQDQRNADG